MAGEDDGLPEISPPHTNINVDDDEDEGIDKFFQQVGFWW